MPVFLSKCFFIVNVVLAFISIANANPLQSSTEIQTEVNRAAARSQVKVDRLSEETARLLREYRAILRRSESLHVYNEQVERLIRSQEEEMASLQAQLREIEVTHREIVPLILRMVDSLAQFVALDRPFLPEERRVRVAELRKLMDRADIAISEKYRRVMEAYQVEAEYGRTIEAYQGVLEQDGDQDGRNRTVHFLRVGRISLIYLTLDGKETGYWNQELRRWEILPEGDRSSIMRGIRIARKEVPADLIRLPIAAPELMK